jgi:hypothetical protein
VTGSIRQATRAARCDRRRRQPWSCEPSPSGGTRAWRRSLDAVQAAALQAVPLPTAAASYLAQSLDNLARAWTALEQHAEADAARHEAAKQSGLKTTVGEGCHRPLSCAMLPCALPAPSTHRRTPLLRSGGQERNAAARVRLPNSPRHHAGRVLRACGLELDDMDAVVTIGPPAWRREYSAQRLGVTGRVRLRSHYVLAPPSLIPA